MLGTRLPPGSRKCHLNIFHHFSKWFAIFFRCRLRLDGCCQKQKKLFPKWKYSRGIMGFSFSSSSIKFEYFPVLLQFLKRLDRLSAGTKFISQTFNGFKSARELFNRSSHFWANTIQSKELFTIINLEMSAKANHRFPSYYDNIL